LASVAKETAEGIWKWRASYGERGAYNGGLGT